MKSMLKKASLVFLLIPWLGFAQQLTVTGTVTDAEGFPLFGATVQIKDTNLGVQTDLDGTYTINVDGSQTLVFSYVSTAPLEVAVNGRSQNTSSYIGVRLADSTNCNSGGFDSWSLTRVFFCSGSQM